LSRTAELLFGTAGIPLRCKGETSAEGIRCVKRLGLGAMELEFVHGVKMGGEAAEECRKAAAETGVSLSVHAPYYINLLSVERQKLGLSRHNVMESCRVLEKCGGGKVVFHPGYYGKLDKKKAFELMRAQFEWLHDACKSEGLKKTALAPETTGKHSAFGDLGELLALAKETRVSITIDFAHLHARLFGGLQKRADYAAILDSVEGKLGKTALKDLHCHFSGIEFTQKGERRHLPVSSNSPPFAPLAQELKARKCGGTIICESPLIEEDALALQRQWLKT